MDDTRDVPISVNYAANLLGLLGAFEALTAVTSFAKGHLAAAVVGLLLAVTSFVLMRGLVRRNRAARVGAIAMGVVLILLGALMLFGGWVGLIGVGLGALLLALLFATAKGRSYFGPAAARTSA